MKIDINESRFIGKSNPMIYGHFLEHFHRQIYGGVFDPGNKLSDKRGFRTDVIEALRKIKTPVIRWSGGCFASAYHWKDGVGSDRAAVFDKSWRVEEPNTFGTDEFIELCREIGCEPYICTNAGTGTAEEMSDWVEYCNLTYEGMFAKQRIKNGWEKPHGVKYWSIGNENYGSWEIGAKFSEEWRRLVLESAKMMKRVDPTTELSAAAIADYKWTLNLLESCSAYLDWISIHGYWDGLWEVNNPANYEQCMAFTTNISSQIDKVRGLLTAMGLEKKVKIAFDEWNLRGWHHPKSMTNPLGLTKDEYLDPRDKNDDNSTYTMADAVFAACFLNVCNKNCDIVGMANFSPVVNTRGCIYTHKDGIVLRSSYHVFDLYANDLGDTVLDSWSEDGSPILKIKDKQGNNAETPTLDVVATRLSDDKTYAVAVVNKDPAKAQKIMINFKTFQPESYRICGVTSPSADSYNDVGKTDVNLNRGEWAAYNPADEIEVPPHSVNIIQLK
jgi:alpha-N-arabinofuranosidase